MRLTRFSDYAMRVLMYMAEHPDRLVTITELAEVHRISRSHLTKVITFLAGEGYLQSIRGRNGGLRLGRAAAEIRIGDVLRSTEEDFRVVECFDPLANVCTRLPQCGLASELQGALGAFFSKLDRVSLADVITPAKKTRERVVPVTLVRSTGKARPRTT